MGSGIAIFPGCIISINVTLGNHCCLNTGVNISHDSSIGNFSTQTINDTFHETLDRNKNIWDFWPLVIVAVTLLLIYIVASRDDEFRVNREAI